ncbi:MAG: hypothetical protein IPH09_15235 [bacterium]|nr:hypothetical protein [bacterium]
MGLITAISATTGTNPAHNFTIDDGSGPVVVRVDDDLAPGLRDLAGGRRAGGRRRWRALRHRRAEIIAGPAADLANNGQGPDVTPLTLVAAAPRRYR